MATNRYTQLSYSNLNDLPMLQLPFEALNNVILKAQQSKDEFAQLSGLTPKYIQESETDKKLASSITAYQNQLTQNLTELAASGNTSEYRRQLGHAKNAIIDMWKPGGAAYALEQRYSQWDAEKKRIQEAMKDAPQIGNYLQQTYKFNDIGYNPGMREYKNLQPANFVKNIEAKEINDWFDKNLGNIKDSLIKEGYSKAKLDSITTLHDFFQVEGVPYNKLVDVFLSTFPQEYIDSILQREQAARFFNPDMPEISTKIFEETEDGKIAFDKQGNIKLNLNNPISKLISGYADMGERRNIKHDRIKDDDELGLEGYKHSLRKKEIDYENAIQTNTLRSRMLGNNSGMPEMNLKINDDGTVSNLQGKDMDVAPGAAGTMAFNLKGLYKGNKNVNKGQTLISAIESGQLEQNYPGLTSIYNKLKTTPDFKEMNVAQQGRMVQEYYNNLRTEMNSFDFAIDTPTGKNAAKHVGDMKKLIFGENGGLGMITNMSLMYWDAKSGAQAVQKSIEDIASDLGMTVEELQKAGSWYGTTKSDNPKTPSGHFLTVTDKKGKIHTILASPESYEKAQIKFPGYIGSSPLYNAKNTSELFLTNIPEIDNIPGIDGKGIYTKREEVYPSDLISAQMTDIQRQYLSGQPVYDNNGNKITNLNELTAYMETFSKERNRLIKTPSENKPQITLGVYNYNDERLGGQDVWDKIFNQIEVKANVYGKE